MTYSRHVVAHAISLRDFVDMGSTGNILLSSDRHIVNVKQMIMGKILPQHANHSGEVEVHVRLSAGAARDEHQHQHQHRDDLLRLIDGGNRVYVWMTPQEAETLDIPLNAINPVMIDHSFPVAAENFMIVSTPLEARTLIWWDSEADYHSGIEVLFEGITESGVRGVLATDPDDTRRLLSKLRAALIRQESQKPE